MKYSFIRPRKKPLLDLLSSYWLIFIAFVVVIFIAFTYFIEYKTSFYIKMLKDGYQEINLQKNSFETIKNEYKILKMQQELFTDIHSSNLMLKNSIKNLFDLIPDQITLNKVFMEENKLILYGQTPSKNAYNMLLAPPLESIFNKSFVKFYLKKRGWYSFVSTNEIKN